MLFLVLVTKQSLENCFGFLQRSEIPTLSDILKIQCHFSTAAAFVYSIFFNGNSCQMFGACIFKTANVT